MSAAPHISVVVPFIDRQQSLPACVEALRAQEHAGGPFEILLVDNGSAEPGAISLPHDEKLVLLREATRGAYAARNTGIRHARAPLLAFTDADCVVDRGWLRAIREGMRDPAVGILIGECRYPAEASLALHLLGAYENAKAEYVVEHGAPAHHFAYANNMAVRASVFAELGPFREWQRAADSELVHRMAASGLDLRLAYSRSMRVTHREFLRLRDRVQRLSVYTRTNTQIATFRELGMRQRAGLLRHMLRRETRM